MTHKLTLYEKFKQQETKETFRPELIEPASGIGSIPDHGSLYPLRPKQ